MGNSESQEHKMNTKLYKWSSGEFRKEYALIYAASGGGLYSPRSCTFYFRVSSDKLVITMDDDLCAGNRVRVNIEFVAVRDDKIRGFKFGPVKFKDSGHTFHQRRRRSSKKEVFFLQYCTTLYDGRRNQLCLYKVRKEKKYLLVFHTAIGNSDDSFNHYMKIECDPSKGIDVNLCGPHIGRAGERELCDTENISGMPPDDVIDNAVAIRNDLKVEDGNNVGPTPPNVYNIINNTGNFEGDGNGRIHNK